MLVNFKKLNLNIGKLRFQTRNFSYSKTLAFIKKTEIKNDSIL